LVCGSAMSAGGKDGGQDAQEADEEIVTDAWR